MIHKNKRKMSKRTFSPPPNRVVLSAAAADSGDVGEVVLDLFGREPSESALGVADPDLDVVLGHLALEALLQGQDRGVDGVFKLQLVIVSERK